MRELLPLEKESHHNLMGIIQFNSTGKCMICKDKEKHQNPILIWDRAGILKLCPDCSKLYTNKQFLLLIEIGLYGRPIREDSLFHGSGKVKE